jgi:hypothetical protein
VHVLSSVDVEVDVDVDVDVDVGRERSNAIQWVCVCVELILLQRSVAHIGPADETVDAEKLV